MNSILSTENAQIEGWRKSLANAWKDPVALLEYLGLGDYAGQLSESTGFPMLVSREFAGRIEAGNIHDPLLRQVLPVQDENLAVAGFVQDPTADQAALKSPALLQKYSGRALVITNNYCASNCRYCFRRHFPYGENSLRPAELKKTGKYLGENPDIDEVILSGGDPLTLSTRRLAASWAALNKEREIPTLRIHTRLPVFLPSRVSPALLDWLAGLKCSKLVVIHSNHAREIDENVMKALGQLKEAGVLLLNQSVLLAGVNDSLSALQALSRRLWEAGVLPYYLHMLDPVAGAAHFQVDESTARQLQAGLRASLPGYLVPRLVREIPGEPGKSAI